MKQLSPTFIGALALGTLCLVQAGIACNAQNPEVNEVQKRAMMSKAAGIHIPFIANEGQIQNEAICFYAVTFGGNVYVTGQGGIVYSLPKLAEEPKEKGFGDGTHQGVAGICVLKEYLCRAKNVEPKGTDRSNTRVNFFIGSDRARWRKNVTAWEAVSFGEIYEGIRLSLRARGNNVEKIFVIDPGSDPSGIRLVIEGAESLRVSETGELVVRTGVGNVCFSAPKAFQEESGRRSDVEVAYHINGNCYGFDVGTYDTSRPLIIDPLLASTFIGGASDDYGADIVVDDSGYVYITGFTTAKLTSSTNYYPATSGAYDISYNGSYDIIVSKFDANLRTLMASTFIGGESNDYSYAIALDSSGNVYVTGSSESTDYPVTPGAYDTEKTTLASDIVISKLDNSLSSLLASTYIEGTSSLVEDEGCDIALGGSGNVLVTGLGGSGYPTTAGAYSNGSGVVVSKLDSDLSAMLASTSIGGGKGYAMALDDSENVYVTGYTYSDSGYPTTTNAYCTSPPGGYDAVVSKLDPDLTNLLASTYLGGYGWDCGYGIVLDSSGSVYVAGHTWAGTTITSDFPTTSSAYDTSHNGSYDVFVSRFDTNLSFLSASTFLGGSDTDRGLDIALDTSGNVYVTGITESTNYPATSGAFDTTFNGQTDVLVSKLDAGLESLLASTFLGGTNSEGDTYAIILGSIAMGPSGNVYLTGMTESSGFPVTAGAYDVEYNQGKVDVYVSKLDALLSEGTGTVSQLALYSDYDGDGKADLAVYHEATGYWYIQLSGSSYSSYSQKFGETGYDPVPGDFDGDAKADLAVYHESSGYWFIYRSSDLGLSYMPFGGSGYEPVPADYDGDGKSDLAVYYEATGYWFIYRSSDYGLSYMPFGGSGYEPVPADYDGDGKADLAVYCESGDMPGYWFIYRSSDYGLSYMPFGGSGYEPVPADFDGDGKSDLAVYHEATGYWYIYKSSTYELSYMELGATGYTPVPGDYDGDGTTDLTVYQESSGYWYILLSGSSYLLSSQQFGESGYTPIQ